MKYQLRKVTGAPLFIKMDAEEQIIAAGIDPTCMFIVTSGWDGKTTTIWHHTQIPNEQIGKAIQAQRRVGLLQLMIRRAKAKLGTPSRRNKRVLAKV